MKLERPTSGRERIIAALDVPDPLSAHRLAAQLAGHIGLVKLGLELYVAHGREALEALRPLGLPIFLDLKLHDIPQTVDSTARGVGGMGVALLTVHASGGAAMIAAARKGLLAGAKAAGLPAPKLLAVTVLTSLSESELDSIGLRGPMQDAVLRLGLLATSAGADGLVCSPLEVQALRVALGPGPLLVTPGVRPAGVSAGDQRRTGTPARAVAEGADYLVLGRPLRDAKDPAAAADAIARELDAPDEA